MGPIADSVAELMAAADRAMAEVRREAGHDDLARGKLEAVHPAYVEALEKKVREQAMALRIAGVSIDAGRSPRPRSRIR